jgi:glycine/D-amino acid oxidase-like deaminating enzyme
MYANQMNNTPIWDDGTWPGLPQLEGALEADVCVVGLGGSGLAAVLELLRLKQTVIGIDAGLVAGGAAGRNGGFVMAGIARFYHQAVAQLGRVAARRAYQATLDQLDYMTQQTPGAIRRVGSLRIAQTEEELHDCTAHRQALTADGFAAEAYMGPEGEGLLVPGDGVFNPLLRCRMLVRQALSGGAQLFEHTPALELPGEGVQTPGGQVRCQKVLVAVDGRLEQLLPELADRVRTARLQMLATAPAPEVHFPRPVYARWGYEYWQQLPDGRIALGGFRDVGGEGEWTHSPEPTEPIQARMEQKLRQLGVQSPITHRWAASVSYTPDGLPIAERVRPNLWAIGAYSGTGNVVGAMCARAVVGQMVLGKPVELFV